MYDEVSLITALQRVDVTQVERREFLLSAIPDIARVETRDDLIVEAIR